MKNTEDQATAARIGRDTEQRALEMGPSTELRVIIRTDRHGHIRPARVEITIIGALTDEGLGTHTTP